MSPFLRLARTIGEAILRFERWAKPTPPRPDQRVRPPHSHAQSIYSPSGKPRSRILIVRGDVAKRVDINGYGVTDALKQAFQDSGRREWFLRRMAQATDEVNIRFDERERLKQLKRPGHR